MTDSARLPDRLSHWLCCPECGETEKIRWGYLPGLSGDMYLRCLNGDCLEMDKVPVEPGADDIDDELKGILAQKLEEANDY